MSPEKEQSGPEVISGPEQEAFEVRRRLEEALQTIARLEAERAAAVSRAAEAEARLDEYRKTDPDLMDLLSDLTRKAIEGGRDGLTGLTNRTTALAQLKEISGLMERRYESARREAAQQDQKEGEGEAPQEQAPERITIMLVDGDHFKRINDTLGHGAGDAALQTIARHLGDNVKRRKTDIVARYGGEEFLLIFPDTTAQQILHDKFNGNGEGHIRVEFEWAGKKHMITMSGGIVEWLSDGSRSVEEAIADADDMLYAAKLDGRDRILYYNQEKAEKARELRAAQAAKDPGSRVE